MGIFLHSFKDLPDANYAIGYYSAREKLVLRFAILLTCIGTRARRLGRLRRRGSHILHILAVNQTR
jgi:hypothetical protein